MEIFHSLRIPYRLCRFSLLVLLGLSATVLCAQDEVVEQDTMPAREKVHIDKASSVKGRVIDTSSYMFLVGDVELSQDSVFIYCDSAVVIDEREVRAFGNVIIQKGDSLSIFSDTLFYHSDTMRARMTGDVVLESKGERMFTPSLEYDLNRDIAYYYSGALLVNDSTQVTSKSGYYLTKLSQARFMDSVVVISPQVTLLADSLDFNTALQRADFIGPTYILQNESSIYCEDGFYDVLGERAEFIRNAEYNGEAQKASADTIRYTGSSSLVNLIGNARFKEGDREIDSDEIEYYEESGETYIIGNAVFRDSLRNVTSSRIEFNRETEILRTLGRSTLVEDGQELTADLIRFDQKTGIGYARGDVIYFDSAAQTILESDSAYFERDSEFVKATGTRRPLLKSIVDADTMFLTADTLLFSQLVDTIRTPVFDTIWTSYIDSSGSELDTFRLDTSYIVSIDSIRRFQGYQDVRLFKGTLQGMCDSLVFNSNDSVFQMIGKPILWSDTTQLKADSIEFALVNGSIDQVFLRQRAIVISEIQGRFYNQIKGKRMVATMVEDELNSLTVRGNAESVYYAMDESGAFIGVNQVVAGQIFFSFAQKQLSGIRFYSEPDGEMKPMGSVDHKSLRLEGFDWLSARRPKTLDDLF